MWEADGKHSGLGLIKIPLLPPPVSTGGRRGVFLDHAPTLATLSIPSHSQPKRNGAGGEPDRPLKDPFAPPSAQVNIQTMETKGAGAASSWLPTKEILKILLQKHRRRRKPRLGHSGIIGKPPTALTPNFQML